MFSSEVNVAYSTCKHEVCNHKCTILCLLECMWVNDLGSVTHTSVRTGLTAALPVLTLVIDFTWLKLLSCKLPFSLLYIVTLWTRELYTVPIHTHATKPPSILVIGRTAQTTNLSKRWMGACAVCMRGLYQQVHSQLSSHTMSHF